MCSQLGWRWSFAFTGLVSLAYFVYFWRVYRDPADDPGLGAKERRIIEQGSPPAASNPPADGNAALLQLLRSARSSASHSASARTTTSSTFSSLAAGYLSFSPAHRPPPLVPLHRRAVVRCHHDGPCGGRMPGGFLVRRGLMPSVFARPS